MSFSVMALLGKGRPDRTGTDKMSYENHLERVKTVKSTIDNKAPRRHPLSNKGEMEKRRRYLHIENQNRILLERLATIVQHKTIDNELSDVTNTHQKFVKKISLQKKRQEMQRITGENHRLLRRIQEVPPAYNHLEWEDDAKHREEIKRILSLYPEYYESEDDKNKKLSGSPTKLLTKSKSASTFLPPIK